MQVLFFSTYFPESGILYQYQREDRDLCLWAQRMQGKSQTGAARLRTN
jgi:hypothetical protein